MCTTLVRKCTAQKTLSSTFSSSDSRRGSHCVGYSSEAADGGVETCQLVAVVFFSGPVGLTQASASQSGLKQQGREDQFARLESDSCVVIVMSKLTFNCLCAMIATHVGETCSYSREPQLARNSQPPAYGFQAGFDPSAPLRRISRLCRKRMTKAMPIKTIERATMLG